MCLKTQHLKFLDITNYLAPTGRKKRFAINLHACRLVENSITNFAINLRMKCFRFATTKFTSNLQAALHNLQIYL
jgi:hypothetical protein